METTPHSRVVPHAVIKDELCFTCTKRHQPYTRETNLFASKLTHLQPAVLLQLWIAALMVHSFIVGFVCYPGAESRITTFCERILETFLNGSTFLQYIKHPHTRKCRPQKQPNPLTSINNLLWLERSHTPTNNVRTTKSNNRSTPFLFCNHNGSKTALHKTTHHKLFKRRQNPLQGSMPSKPPPLSAKPPPPPPPPTPPPFSDLRGTAVEAAPPPHPNACVPPRCCCPSILFAAAVPACPRPPPAPLPPPCCKA